MNCRKCTNTYICYLIKQAYILDGEVSCLAADQEDDKTQLMERSPNIIVDTLAKLLPKCCGKFSKKHTKYKESGYLGPLTPARVKVLKMLAKLTDKNGHSPTVREIGSYLGKTSSTIQEHLSGLYLDGYLNKVAEGTKACNYFLTEAAKSKIKGLQK